MLSDDKRGTPMIEFTQKLARAKVAISNPEVTRSRGFEHLMEQGTLLSMAIFAGDDVRNQAGHGLVNHQGFARQSRRLDVPEGLETTLSGFDAVAINDFDSVAFEPGLALPTHSLDQRGKFSRTIANEF